MNHPRIDPFLPALLPAPAEDAHADAYGDHCADYYDDLYPAPSSAQLGQLLRLANGGRVLEVGVGTGRIALALAQRGIEVHGIDASARMLAALRRKPGGADIGLTLGDFARHSVPGEFALVLCLVDTLALLPDRPAQASAVARLSRNLPATGYLLLETTQHDATTPAQHMADLLLQTRVGPRAYRVSLNALQVADVDRLAGAAGLRLIQRWRDWQGRPWQGELGNVISIYQRVGAAQHGDGC